MKRDDIDVVVWHGSVVWVLGCGENNSDKNNSDKNCQEACDKNNGDKNNGDKNNGDKNNGDKTAKKFAINFWFGESNRQGIKGGK